MGSVQGRGRQRVRRFTGIVELGYRTARRESSAGRAEESALLHRVRADAWKPINGGARAREELGLARAHRDCQTQEFERSMSNANDACAKSPLRRLPSSLERRALWSTGRAGAVRRLVEKPNRLAIAVQRSDVDVRFAASHANCASTECDPPGARRLLLRSCTSRYGATSTRINVIASPRRRRYRRRLDRCRSCMGPLPRTTAACR